MKVDKVDIKYPYQIHPVHYQYSPHKLIIYQILHHHQDLLTKILVNETMSLFRMFFTDIRNSNEFCSLNQIRMTRLDQNNINKKVSHGNRDSWILKKKKKMSTKKIEKKN